MCIWLFTHEESVLLPGKQNKQGALYDYSLTVHCTFHMLHTKLYIYIYIEMYVCS